MKNRFFIFLVLLSFLSCEKEIDEVNIASSSSDFLVFKDYKDFEAFLIKLDSSEEKILYLKTRRPNFKSYAEIYESFDWNQLEEEKQIASLEDYNNYPVSIIKRDGELFVEPIVDAHLLSFVVNEDRIFQIGTEIHQVNRDELITVRADEVVDYTDLKTSKTALIRPISRRTNIKNQKAYADAVYNYVYGGSDHRLQGIWKEVNLFLYSEISAQTEHRKRGLLGAWFANKEDVISCTVTDALFIEGDDIIDIPFATRTRYDKSDCKITLNWKVNYVTITSLFQGNSVHSSTDDGVFPSPYCDISF